LSGIENRGLLRSLRKPGDIPGDIIDFSTNDYLGLRCHPEMAKASADAAIKYGSGSGSSRLISGNSELHEELEDSLRKFKKLPSALIASSGYALNVSLIPALVAPGDAVILDRLCHASLVDGAKLSGARLFVFSHCNMDSLESALKRAIKYRRRLILSDSVFSMDGDCSPLVEVADLAEKYGAETFVDDAHATGVIGKEGCGAVENMGLSNRVDYIVGTFSKAYGSFGGFAVSRHDTFAHFAINTVRGVIYSTALPPSVLAASIKGLELSRKNEEGRQRIGKLRECFAKKGVCASIIPIEIGDEKKSVEISKSLLNEGFLVPAVRFPTVAKGSARLRISITANHSIEQVEKFIHTIKSLGVTC
jgi:8-amino-7-oxononanoate synthase